MKTRFVLIFSTALAVASCHKEKDPKTGLRFLTTDFRNGLTKNTQEINGYFFASYRTSLSNSGNPYGSLNAYGLLSEPGLDLISVYNHRTERLLYQKASYSE